VVTVSRHRLILAEQADAVRVALFGETSDWVADPRSGDSPGGPWRWRTPFGLRVTISQDSLLDQPMLELSADDETTDAEAAELATQLPRVVSAVRFADALEVFTQTRNVEQQGAMLPLLAATLPDGDLANRGRVLDAAAAAVISPDARERAGGVLAAAYLEDESLSARVRALAASDPDFRVRTLAGRIVHPRAPAKADWVRRVTFVAESVAEEFLPFATERGWSLIDRQPGTDGEGERVLWQADTAVRVILVRDTRLERDRIVVNGTSADAAAAVDETERLVRARFPTADLDDVLDMIIEADAAADRLLLWRVAAAAAPVDYHPRMYAVIADLFGDPVTPLRGFAVGATVYYPWPEVVPLLTWSAGHDPEPAIRGLADIGLDAARRVHGHDLAEIMPATGYFVTVAGRPALVRSIAARPDRIDHQLDDDQLWHSVTLPDDFPAGYREVTADEAERFAHDSTSG